MTARMELLQNKTPLPGSSSNLFYLHVQGEIAGANAVYGLDEAPDSAMPSAFWIEFPRRRGFRPRITTSQVLNRLGAWGFRLVAFAPAVETHAEHLARLFYPNSIYLRPVSKYFPMFYWILCRDPGAEAPDGVQKGAGAAKQTGVEEAMTSSTSVGNNVTNI